jgi:signal peptidase I
MLANYGMIVYTTKGRSMEPLFHQGRDIVIISPPNGRLKPMDVALYRRGKAYVLHRVIEVTEDGYLIRGDNTYALERVPEEAVIGVLTGFKRKGKDYSVEDAGYLRYVRFWCAVYPVRRVCVGALRRVKRVLRPVLVKMGWRRRK